MPAQTPKPIVYPSLHEQSTGLPPVEWLWPEWIPAGMLTLLGAAPGVGKSLVALDLARRIIHDEPFPDGTPVPCPGSNVLSVDAEVESHRRDAESGNGHRDGPGFRQTHREADLPLPGRSQQLGRHPVVAYS